MIFQPVTPIPGLAPTVGLYSQAVPLPRGATLLFVAGQLSVDTEGKAVAVGDFEGQVRTVFANLAAVVEGAGSDLRSVMKMTTYLVEPDHVARFYAERERLFGELYPTGVYPANTLLVVERLVRPEFLIEIEAVAAVPPPVVTPEESHG